MTDHMWIAGKLSIALTLVSLAFAWKRHRDNIKMRRAHIGGHRLHDNTYYGHMAWAIVGRVRQEITANATAWG